MRIEHRLLTPDTAYGIFIDLNEEWPNPNPFAAKRVDFAVSFGGRTVELSWEELLKKLGMRQ
jgi:hypothetical protein